MLAVHRVLQIPAPKGAYIERVLGGFNSPNRIVNRMAFALSKDVVVQRIVMIAGVKLWSGRYLLLS